MKRRTWFKTVAAMGVAVLCPWLKRAKAESGQTAWMAGDLNTLGGLGIDSRDQVARINQLRDHITLGRTTEGRAKSFRLLATDRPGDVSVQLYCEDELPGSDGKYRVALVAIKKRLAQTMDDMTLCQALRDGLHRSATRGHRVGFLGYGPPTEWIQT